MVKFCFCFFNWMAFLDDSEEVRSCFSFFLFFLFFFFFRVIPVAYGCSRAGVLIGAGARRLHHRHSNAGARSHLCPTLQCGATPDP